MGVITAHKLLKDDTLLWDGSVTPPVYVNDMADLIASDSSDTHKILPGGTLFLPRTNHVIGNGNG